MMRSHSIIPLKQIIYFCLESDGSNLDSFIGGSSSDDEQKIDMLADNYERRAKFSLVSIFVSDKVMCSLLGFSCSKTAMFKRLFNRIF